MSTPAPQAGQLTDDLRQLSARLGWSFRVDEPGAGDVGPFADTDVVLLHEHLTSARGAGHGPADW